MTRVEFHTGLADPLHFACRLLRKAYRQGARVAVTAPPDVLTALDRELWTFEAQDFVPHRRVHPDRDDDPARQRTPIWLVDGAWAEGCPPVLVNLGAEAPEASPQLARIVELVSADAAAMQQARARWRLYEARGLSPQHHRSAGAD